MAGFRRRMEAMPMPDWKPMRSAAAFVLTFGLGAAAAMGAYTAWDAARSHDFTLPSGRGALIAPGGAVRGEAHADWQPPTPDQKDVFVGVQFGSAATVRANCGRTSIGAWAAGCERTDGERIPLIVAANPCGIAEPYALTLCHEIGHAEGWEPWHGHGHFARRSNLYAVRLDGTDGRGRRLEWATVVEAANPTEASVKARRKARRYLPWFRTERVAAFNA